MTKKRTTSRKSSGTRSGKRPQKKSRSPGSIIFILILLGLAFLCNRLGYIDADTLEAIVGIFTDQESSSEQTGSPQTTPVVVEPVSGEWYKIYFTTPQYPDKVETQVETIATGLIQVINSAQQSLDIAIYELNLDNIGDAILAARDRGVAVRMVTDTDELEELETLIRLEEEGIPIVPDERSAIMHNKFVVVDNKAVWTGSWNFTSNDTFRNNNNALYLQSPELAQNYKTEFEEMFIRKEFGPTSTANTPHPQIMIGDTLIETCFAPEDKCADQIVNLIKQAQKSVRFMAFSFTEEAMGQAVEDKAGAGLFVQGVFETRGSETEYSEFTRLKNQKREVWQDGNPYTLHHKVFIIDDETVVFGSFNFSDNANKANDENALLIHSPDIAKEFLAEFARVHQQALNPPN
jgi:phosphatidylserine/phosphatidylglycerophosphate/cardiolipin synthase-like enzyme